ncbi:hypothetical protein BGZ80_005573 [Entomortierella chlamydospora]|uniref:GST C-terminal domain-containing protein n=1 Tax=Entomortierella chlamydospora TaxID=101097 RepID=A0A9P6MJD4_9FUNG|nr:hypothetical protein BGZ79_003974 [Entomortierella chlamydospora]KAG0004675.1 hypothetical protein BGZ80_005573 [Entomortierella chlamydospora]
MLPIPTKGLSTEAMTKLSQASDNEYTVLYFPWYESSPTLRAILAMYAKKYTFAHPDVGWVSLKLNTPYSHLPILYEASATSETLELVELSVIEIYLGKVSGLKQIPEWTLFDEQALKENSLNGNYVGDMMSVADLRTATIIDAVRAISGGKLISREKIPAIMAMCDHVQQDPKYADWKASDQWKALTKETITRFNLSPA